jgi:epoxyqueuosine reductase
MVKNKKIINLLISAGATIYGFADISMLPVSDRHGMPSGIAIGIALDPEIISRLPSGPNVKYFDEYDNVTARLDEICISVSHYLSDKGYRAIAQTVEYSKKERQKHPKHYAPVPHKTVAALAGLGWISKSSMLITKEYGSAVRLTSILTDIPLETMKYEYTCLCGDCRICADSCPGNAIKNIQWYVGIDREELVVSDLCRKAVKARGEKYGRDHGTCGICMAVCPYTKKYTDPLK